MENKQYSNAELAEGYWLSTGLVWWRAIQHMQVEYRKMHQDTRTNSKTIAKLVMEHTGSGQIPPPFKLRIPNVAPHALITAIAGMQAFAIEIILKGALAREGKEDVDGHNLSKLWCKLNDNVKIACEKDFSSRLEAAESAGFRPTTEGRLAPQTIKDVLPRHNDDFMVFRYGQTGTKKGKRKMRQQVKVQDRLQILLILYTLENVIVRERQPLTSKDEEQMQTTGKLVAEWFSEERHRTGLYT